MELSEGYSKTDVVGATTTGCPIQKPLDIKALICPAICACNNKATLSKTGAELKQQCVSKALQLYDKALANKEYRQI